MLHHSIFYTQISPIRFYCFAFANAWHYNQVPVTNSETRTIALSLSPTVVRLTNMHGTTTLRVLLWKPD